MPFNMPLGLACAFWEGVFYKIAPPPLVTPSTALARMLIRWLWNDVSLIGVLSRMVAEVFVRWSETDEAEGPRLGVLRPFVTFTCTISSY